jgi:hypothetical protein
MSWKTSDNINAYITPEDDNGLITGSPPLQSLNYVSSSLEGSYETIESDTKLPGRNPEKSRRGTDSCAGNFVANFRPLEHDKMFEAVLCSEDGFVKNETLSDTGYDVYEMIPGNKQRSFSFLKYFTQDPKLYQLFRGLQFNTLSISFTISALVKLTFGLMGKNNPKLESICPVGMANVLPACTTEEFITLQGSWKFRKNGVTTPPVEFIDGVDITLEFNNNMANLPGLFQEEAIDKSLGMLNITGTINKYLKEGELYNTAKDGGDGELFITVRSDEDDIEYEFILNISFSNSTLSGDTQVAYALPFSTYGENRFTLRKKVPAAITEES